MWISRTEDEIAEAIEAGWTEETATFDAKVSLPGKGKAKDLAVDVAAMANDGGTLLYGLDEDENGRPVLLKPFPLKGTRERVDNIIRTSISEPPEVKIREIPSDNDPSAGYLVVHVPPSPRSPHMVVIKGDHRYYGRSATGNAPLNEGDVARLYERRQRWEVDRNAMLEEAVSLAPIDADENHAYLHLFARPVALDEDIFNRARGERNTQNYLHHLMEASTKTEIFPNTLYPDFPSGRIERRANGWTSFQGLGREWQERKDPEDVLELNVGLDGYGRLFCGRAGIDYRDRFDNSRSTVIEVLIAGLATRFAHIMGTIYAEGSYLGQVDMGIAVVGLRNRASLELTQKIRISVPPTPYDRDEYRRTGRFSAHTMKERPKDVARSLTMPLIDALTRDSFDPFTDE